MCVRKLRSGAGGIRKLAFTIVVEKKNLVWAYDEEHEEEELEYQERKDNQEVAIDPEDLTLGADGSSRKAICDGGLWKFLNVRQIYPLINQS